MSSNPFETPLAQEAAVVPVTGQIDVGVCLSEAWRITWAKFGDWIGPVLVFFFCTVFAAITIIGYFVIVPVLMWGLVRFLLELLDGRGEMSDVFSGFKNYGTALGSFLLGGVVILVISLLGNGPQYIGTFMELPLLTLGGSVLSIACSIFVIPRLYFFPFLIVERGFGALDALKASWTATSDQKMNLFVITLLSGLLIIGGALACLVGMLPGAVMSYLMWTVAYRQLMPKDRMNFAA